MSLKCLNQIVLPQIKDIFYPYLKQLYETPNTSLSICYRVLVVGVFLFSLLLEKFLSITLRDCSSFSLYLSIFKHKFALDTSFCLIFQIYARSSTGKWLIGESVMFVLEEIDADQLCVANTEDYLLKRSSIDLHERNSIMFNNFC